MPDILRIARPDDLVSCIADERQPAIRHRRRTAVGEVPVTRRIVGPGVDAGDGLAAVDLYRQQNFDVILMDIVMPKMDGIEALRKIIKMDPEAKVILMTAYSEEESIQIAKSEGARRLIRKPVKIDQLIDMIKEATAEESILVVDKKGKEHIDQSLKIRVTTRS